MHWQHCSWVQDAHAHEALMLQAAHVRQVLLLQVAQLALLQREACALALRAMVCHLILPVRSCEALLQVQVQMI